MAALRLVPEVGPEQVQQAEEADRAALGALYDAMARALPTLDPELSEVRASLLALAPRIGRAAGRSPLVPTPEAS